MTMILLKKGQSTIELVVVAMAVMLGIVVGGPYVLRSINAHFKLWDTAVQESNEDHLVKATKDQIGLTGGTCTFKGWKPTPNCAIHGCGPLEREYIKDVDPPGCDYGSKCVADDSCCSVPVSTGRCWRSDVVLHMAPDTALSTTLITQGFKNTGCTTSDLIYRIPCGNNAGLNLCKEHLTVDADGPRDCRPVCRSSELVQNASLCVDPAGGYPSQWNALTNDQPLSTPVADAASCGGDVCGQYCNTGYHYNPAEPTKCIKCGDGTCDVDETCQTCPCDCITCPPVHLTLSAPPGTWTPGFCSNHNPNGCIPGVPQSGPMGSKTFTVSYEGDYTFSAKVTAGSSYWFFQAEPALTGPGYYYTRLFNRHNTNRCNGHDSLKADSTHENECAGATFYCCGTKTVTPTSDVFHLYPGDYTITLEYDNRWGYEWKRNWVGEYSVTVNAPPGRPAGCNVNPAPTAPPTPPPTVTLFYNDWCYRNATTSYLEVPAPGDVSTAAGCNHAASDCAPNCGFYTGGTVVNYNGGTIECLSSTTPIADSYDSCRLEKCPVFKVNTYSSAWGTFLQTYSIWSAPESDSDIFLNQDTTYSAPVTVPADGTYTIKFSHDDEASLYVDGALIVSGEANNQTSFSTHPVTLTAGKHLVRMIVKNLPQTSSTLDVWRYNPGGAALTLEDGSGNILLSSDQTSSWLSNGNNGTCVTTAPPPAAAYCGDSVCNPGEDCNSCASDCGACPCVPSWTSCTPSCGGSCTITDGCGNSQTVNGPACPTTCPTGKCSDGYGNCMNCCDDGYGGQIACP